MDGGSGRWNGLGAAGGWHYTLLPALEQNALFQLSADGQLPEDPSETQKKNSQTVMSTSVSVFNCPSRRPVQLMKSTGSVPYNASSQPEMTMRGDYVANYGAYNGNSRWPTAVSGPSVTDALAMRKKEKNWPDHTSDHTGVCYMFSKVSLGQIRDGLSNTILFGEKGVDSRFYTDYLHEGTTSWTDARCDFLGDPHCQCIRSSYCGYYKDDVFQEELTRVPKQDRWGYLECSRSFGSAHSGALGIALCDGSVQRLTYSVSPEVFHCLGNKADGKVVTLPQ
ncbi:MAG: DUF1559 domain-containing protein [Planctomycetia bacterium]|nr:DUF1559 domain-containing protein [Planctomycetia bacterium]MDO5112930.1 DUF1559 domain-containing protein [Planctomycetia bacterium]